MEHPSITTLVEISEAYRAACGAMPETTVSHRVFGDTKKIAQLRAGADITLGRYNAAMRWFATHWPEGAARPLALGFYAASEKDVA